MGVVYNTKQKNKAVKEMMERLSSMDDDARKNAKATLHFAINRREKTRDEWRLDACRPKYGPLNPLLNAFHEETDIPLEIPFFCVFHLISGLLLRNEARLDGPLGEVSPELWTIVLAPSGAGKTISHSIVSKHAPVQSNFPECASSAAFFEAFLKAQEAQGYGLWFQDEFAQILKQMETPNSPLSESKSYLLRAYSNERIERSTKKGGDLAIDKPRLGILGLNTDQSFINAMSMESMLDGFAQRFGIVIAKEDEKRHITDYPIYDMTTLWSEAKVFWDTVGAVPLQKSYRLTEEGFSLYRSEFKRLYRSDISKSFYRRIMFRAFKYALVYHVLLGKSNDTIDGEDIGYSMSLIELHLENMAEFISMKEGIGAFVETARKTKGWAVDIAKRKGRAKARDLQAKDRRVFDSAKLANDFLDFLEE